jgi:hypothetical protein
MLRTFGLALLSNETESPLQLAAWYQMTGISFTVDSIAPFLLLARRSCGGLRVSRSA